MRISIFKKVSIIFLLLIIISIIIVGTYSYQKAKNAIMLRTFDQLTSVRIEKKNRIEDFFNQRIKDINNITNSEDIKKIIGKFEYIQNTSDTSDGIEYLKKEYNRYLNAYLHAENCYKRFILCNTNGTAICMDISDNISQTNFSIDTLDFLPLQNLWQKVKETNKPVIEDFKFDNTINKPAIFIGKSISSGKNKSNYMVALEVSIDAINNIMFEDNPHNGLGQSGEAYLVGNDYLMRSTSRFQDNSVFNTRVQTTGVKDAFKGIVGSKVIDDYRNISVLSSYSKVDIDGLNWVVLAEIDTKEAMIPIYSIRNDILYLSIIITILFFGIVVLISKMITAPIIKLKNAADKISDGEYGCTLSVKNNDEIGDLTNAFNNMTIQLKDQSEKLEQERIMRLRSMIDGQEIERQRLSRELHDGLGQSILAIKMMIERALNTNPAKTKEILNDARNLFSTTLKDIRNTSNNLMPAVLNEFGIITALNNLHKEIKKNTGINVKFTYSKQKYNLDNKTETYIYRIAQEALNNVIKHADATCIDIDYTETEKEIIFTVKDNGKGFSLNHKYQNGNGISNMKERVNLLDGKFEILSSKNKGTSVKAFIPYKDI